MLKEKYLSNSKNNIFNTNDYFNRTFIHQKTKYYLLFNISQYIYEK